VANEGERDLGERDEGTDKISYTLCLAESRRHDCTKFQIKIEVEEIKALIDTG
jgi:hypothetical protein